jgi:hypothetical protein
MAETVNDEELATTRAATFWLTAGSKVLVSANVLRSMIAEIQSYRADRRPPAVAELVEALGLLLDKLEDDDDAWLVIQEWDEYRAARAFLARRTARP